MCAVYGRVIIIIIIIFNKSGVPLVFRALVRELVTIRHRRRRRIFNSITVYAISYLHVGDRKKTDESFFIKDMTRQRSVPPALLLTVLLI